MSLDDEAMEQLFSYGTLQSAAVQLATFGRKLEGAPDGLAGYRLAMIQIDDREFVTASESPHHRIVTFTGNGSDVVEGLVLRVTDSELEQADAYEPAWYQRVRVKLRSGTLAWVYVDAGQPRARAESAES